MLTDPFVDKGTGQAGRTKVDTCPLPLANWPAQVTAEQRRQSTCRIEEKSDQTIGDLMKLREVG